MDAQALNAKTTLTVHEAAQLMVSSSRSLAEAEGVLAHAIDQGELPASITRWASEQWDGARLGGNIDRTRTLIARADLDHWLRRQRGT